MDIRKLAVSQTARMVVLDADESAVKDELGKELAINFYGPGSKQYAKAQAKQSNRMMEKLKKKGKIEETAEQKRESDADFLADCTESFENIELDDLNGRALFLAVYKELEIGFIADQGSKFLNDWANFKKPSAQS